MVSMLKVLPKLIQQYKILILIDLQGLNVKGAININPTI